MLEVLDFPDSDEFRSSDHRRELLRRFDRLPLDRLLVKRAHNWAGNISIGGSPSCGSYVPCTFPWHSLVVMWDGRVGPCPHDFMGEIVLGDATRESLETIFRGPAMSRLRRQHVEGRLDPDLPCMSCDSVRRDTVLGIPTASLRHLRR